MNHIFSSLVPDLVKLGLREEDVLRISLLVEVLSSRVIDLRQELQDQPKHQLTAAFYSNLFKKLKDDTETQRDTVYYNMYHYLVNDKGESRPSDSKVASILRQDPSYLMLLTRLDEFKHAHDQLGALHSALVTRARMLEQISNNDRAQLKSDTEDNPS